MATSLSSPADIVNDALRRIGYKLRVGKLDDGSEAAGYALDIYGQTRDTMLRDGDWPFAQREAVGALLKSAPPTGYFPPDNWDPATFPPIGWRYSFTYPADALKIRSVRPQPMFVSNMVPQPTLFSVVNDNGYTPPRRVIVANLDRPVIVYAARVTDPTTWSVDFTEALCAALGRRLAPSLVNLDVEKLEGLDEQASTAIAKSENG